MAHAMLILIVMKLYYSPGACSLAPHIALREAERSFELARVDLALASARERRGLLPRSIPKGSCPRSSSMGPEATS